MRVAALNDVHANLPALEAVLDEVIHVRVDAIVFGGDVIMQFDRTMGSTRVVNAGSVGMPFGS